MFSYEFCEISKKTSGGCFRICVDVGAVISFVFSDTILNRIVFVYIYIIYFNLYVGFCELEDKEGM